MEPRPPKPPRSTPRQPQQQPPSWDPSGQPAPSSQPPAGNRRDSGYPGSNRYPEYPPYDQQQPGYGRGAAYPPPPGQNQQPGYGQQQPPDPYAGYQRPIYPPAGSQGSYPAAYPGNTPDPYAGYGGQQPYPPQPGAYPPAQTGQLPVQAPAGRSGSGGWIAPLPDEELSSIQPSPYGAGYGGGGFSGDPRSGRATPGPNRQTQIIAALAIGGLALMILAIVIGFIVFGGDDDDPGDTPTSIAGITTGLTPTTTDTAQAPTATVPAGEAAVTPPTAPATETATEQAQTDEPTAAPTEPPTDTADQTGGEESGLFNGDDGESLLPSVDELPQPNFVMTTTSADQRFNRAEVASSLGDVAGGPIDQELRTNGFDSNWRREFAIDPDFASNGQTSVFFVSATVFRTVQGATDSYHLYLDAATDSGYEEVDGESLGDQSTSLQAVGEGTAAVMYIQQDNVIFRIYAYSLDGDPTADLVALAQTVLAKMP
jgi:hypothetical protein